MELKEYLKVLKNNIILVLLMSFGGLFIGLVLARSLSQGYVIEQTFIIENTASQTDVNSAYYSQEKARNFTDTATAIIESANFKKEVQMQNEAISAKKNAPQLITLTAAAQNPNDAKELITRAQNIFNSKLASLGQNDLFLKEIASLSEPSPKVVSKQVFALSGLILGFAAALFALSLKTYLKL